MPFELTPPGWNSPPKKKFRTAKQRALAEWRRIDLTEEEGALKNSTKTAADVLSKVLKSVGFDRRETEVQILKVWDNIMDPAVSRHSKPVALKNGTLIVNVDSNAWHAEIMVWHRVEILKRLRHAFGPDLIKAISFRVG